MAEMVNVRINGIETEVEKGTTILQLARKLNIYVPTLCAHPDLRQAGACRMCVVEVKGMRTLQSACSFPITSEMDIFTTTAKVRKVRRDILALLLKNHVGECQTCKRNGNCELQRLAAEFGLHDYLYGKRTERRYSVDDTGYAIVRDPDKCINCKRCVRTCSDIQAVGVLGTLYRGADTKVTTFMEKNIAETLCVNCGQCINRCPTGALTEKDATSAVWEALEDPNKHVVIQTAPAPRAAIGELFGLPAGTSMTKKMNTALRLMGFDRIFDTNTSADLTIMEEGTELLIKLKKVYIEGMSKDEAGLPGITSCSPGWIKWIEQFYPEYLPKLSTAKSPQQMFGALVKTYYAQKMGIDPANIVSVSLMPCTAKKFECERPEMRDSGYKDVDYVLTTRELGAMIKEAGIDLPNLPESEFDSPLGLGSGAGLIFGATGGVAEAAARTIWYIVTGENVPMKNLEVVPLRGFEGVKIATLPKIEKTAPGWEFMKGIVPKIAVAHGLANAKKLMDMLKAGELEDVFCIEVMACPGGCLGGGGQPQPTSPEIREARMKAIYEEDRHLPYRQSHENPYVHQLYEEFLGEPMGELSHKLLHTHYCRRSRRM